MEVIKVEAKTNVEDEWFILNGIYVLVQVLHKLSTPNTAIYLEHLKGNFMKLHRKYKIHLKWVKPLKKNSARRSTKKFC